MKKVFWIIWILPVLVFGEILETSRFSDLLDHIGESPSSNLLIILDIDNTLLKATQQLGSVAWGESLSADLKKKGVTHREAEGIVNILWRTVQPKMKVEPVDEDIATVIHEIQRRNISIVCLTSRAPQEWKYTLEQLQSIDIVLSRCGLVPKQKLELALDPKALYKEGIVFATPLHKKSTILLRFFEENNAYPEKVIFVDDKWGHVQDVSQALERRGIPCTGIRFGGADGDLESYDPKIAEIQWKAFPKYLSDIETLGQS